IFKQLETIAERFSFKLSDPIADIPEEAINMILYGGNEKFSVVSKTLGITREYKIDFEGIIRFIENQYNENTSASVKRWAKEYMDKAECPECGGSRLRKESMYFKVY